MDKKRAIWISVLLYAATFLIGIIVALALGTDLSGETPITKMHWVLSIILSVILAGLFSLWYFKGKKVEINQKEGLYLGLTFLIVGIFFDLLFIIPYLTLGVGDITALLNYYQDPFFWISVVLIIVTPVVVGKWKEKK